MGFPDDVQGLAEDANLTAAYSCLGTFIDVTMLQHLKKSINQAHYDNGTYEHIAKHWERELELTP